MTRLLQPLAHIIRSTLGLAGLSERLDRIDGQLATLSNVNAAAVMAREPPKPAIAGFVTAHLRNGLEYALSVDTSTGDSYHRDVATGALQGEPTWCFLMDWLRPDEVFFDLGANIGTFSIPAGMLGANVHAFEMLSENIIHLERAARYNDINTIAIVQCAVSDHAGLVGASGMSAWGAVSANAVVSTPAVTIDDYVRLRGIKGVAVMKIDIEGSEKLALAGAARTLADFHPDIVIESNTFQCGDHGYSYRDCLRILVESGYQIYRIHLDRLCPWTAAMTQEIVVVDYFATIKSAEDVTRRSGRAITPFTDADMVASIIDTDRQGDTHRRHVLAVAQRLPATVVNQAQIGTLLERWTPLAAGEDFADLCVGSA